MLILMIPNSGFEIMRTWGFLWKSIWLILQWLLPATLCLPAPQTIVFRFNKSKLKLATWNILGYIAAGWVSYSPVRYAKFESIRYFIDIDISQNCLIDIDVDIFQNHHIDIDIFQNHFIDIDIFKIPISISISISIFSTSPYRYRYRYRYFSKVSIYRQSIFPIDILTRRRSKKTFFTGVHREGVIKCVLQGQKNAFFITFWIREVVT